MLLPRHLILIGSFLSACAGPETAPDKFASFELLDTDKSSTVSFSEWRIAIDRAASALPQNDATARYRRDQYQLFRNLDVNSDLLISRNEWANGKFEIRAEQPS